MQKKLGSITFIRSGQMMHSNLHAKLLKGRKFKILMHCDEVRHFTVALFTNPLSHYTQVYNFLRHTWHHLGEY